MVWMHGHVVTHGKRGSVAPLGPRTTARMNGQQPQGVCPQRHDVVEPGLDRLEGPVL